MLEWKNKRMSGSLRRWNATKSALLGEEEEEEEEEKEEEEEEEEEEEKEEEEEEGRQLINRASIRLTDS